MHVPVVGNTWAVGLAFQAHLVFVAFVMGIAILAPLAEWLGLRHGGEHWDRLARSLGSTITRIFSFAATWAVFGLVLLFGLYPRLFGLLTSIFFWPLVVVGGIWLVMTVSAYLYYHTWERLGQRRKWHMVIGWTFAGSAFLFITLITELSSYQLTPADPSRWLTAAFNPSWIAEVIHRHIGNLSYAGLILAAYAGMRLLFLGSEGPDRAYYDWLGHFGLLFGIGMALLQPFGGWFYAHQVQTASPKAYERMMLGEDAPLFLVQTFFLGAVIFLGNVYLSQSMKRGEAGRRSAAWARNSTWVIGLCALLAIVPKEWPLGQMTPWKYIALGGMILLSAINLVLYLRTRGFVWGRIGRGPALSLALTGLSIVVLLVVMGVIRESARGSDLIYGQPGAGQSQQIDQP